MPIETPYISSAPDGTPCIGVSVSYVDPADAFVAAQVAAAMWATIGARYPLCPGVTPTPVTPAMVAITYWTSATLPTAAPAITPGYAVAGLRMFLETHGATSKTFDVPGTPFGDLHIQATGTYTVDWGDGTTDGPYKAEGAGFPDGTITHVWQRAATVTVTVTESWTAVWRLGGATGTLTTLRTTSAIPAFEVRDAQAVNG